MRKQQKPASRKESAAKPTTSQGGSSKKPEKMQDGGNEDDRLPTSNTEMENHVVNLICPKFLWDLESSTVDCILLSVELTDEPSQDIGEASKTSANKNRMDDNKFSSARESGRNEDDRLPTSNTEMENLVVNLLYPKLLWDLESSTVDCILLSIELTDEPSQDIGEASQTSANTNRMDDNKFSSARESEPGSSHPRNEKDEDRLNIVSREQWEAIRPRKVFSRPLLPFQKVSINYCDLPFYDTLTKIGLLSVIKKNQQLSLRVTDDIVCNFIVDDLGVIYEGRGWDAEWEPTVFRIDIIGEYSNKFPSDKEFQVCKSLIQEGIRMGKIIHNYWLMSPNLKCDRLLQEFFKD